MSSDNHRRLQYQRAVGKHNLSSAIEEFDWAARPSKGTDVVGAKPLFVAGQEYTQTERITRYINQLYTACMMCSICDIGLKQVDKHGICRDPHLLSNRIISEYMVISDKPMWEDISNRDNGNTLSRLDKVIADIGLAGEVYTTYMRKCCGEQEDTLYYNNCISYLDLEIKILQPKLIIAVGKRVYEYLLGAIEHNYTKCLLKPTASKYGIKLLAVGELTDELLIDNMTKVSKVIKKLKGRYGTHS